MSQLSMWRMLKWLWLECQVLRKSILKEPIVAVMPSVLEENTEENTTEKVAEMPCATSTKEKAATPSVENINTKEMDGMPGVEGSNTYQRIRDA